MDDLISRQAAIDRATKEHDFFRGAVTVSDKARRDELLNVMCWLGELPPIQPEPHWIPVAEDTPDEERECWITPKTTSKVYRGVFTRHYGECHRTGFICNDGFMWLNTALAWMYCELPEPYKGVTE